MARSSSNNCNVYDSSTSSTTTKTMKCQATKTRWIHEARDKGCYSIILYVNADEVCNCLQVQHRSNHSSAYSDLEDGGYTIIEEIFL